MFQNTTSYLCSMDTTKQGKCNV